MATFPKSTPLFFFFLLITLLFSLQTHARDSHFFSKVTRDNIKPVDDVQQVKLEAKEEQQQQQQQPAFLPQTTNTAAYGLYSRQIELDSSPSTTTTTTNKYQTQPQKEVPAFDNNKNTFYSNNMETLESTPATTTTTESELYNYDDQRKNYAPELQGVGEYTKESGDSYFYSNNNNNKNKELDSYSYFTGEKQGMSDTRFLENGRYFHDINNEKPTSYVPTYNYGAYQQQKTNNGRSPEYYNNDGFYSGSTEAYYKSRARAGGEQGLQEEDEFDP